jgi:hypothetical protein
VTSRPWLRILVLIVVALAARGATFGNPIIHVDEQFYLSVAIDMLHGAVPYIDVWDRKQFGLFLVYLPAAAFGPVWGVYAYQAMAFACVVATAAMIARAAERADWGRGAMVGAILYILWLDIADGAGGQTPVFYNVLTLGAVLLIGGIPAGGAGRPRGLAAMALVGLALQIKFSVVFEGLWFGLWLLWRARGAGLRLGAVTLYGIALVLVALLPTVLVAAGFWLAGHWGAFVFANFQSIGLRHADPAIVTFENFEMMICLLSVPVIMALGGRHRPTLSPDAVVQRMFVYGWLSASLIGLLLFGSWFNHYALPVFAPASCAACGFAAGGRRTRIASWVVLALGFAAGQYFIRHWEARRGTPREFRRVMADIGTGPGCLFVYSGEPYYYTASRRCTLTKFLFPSHINSEREHGAIGVDQSAEIDRVLDLRPAVVVVTSYYEGERVQVRERALADLARAGYRVTARDPLGEQTVAVYRAVR